MRLIDVLAAERHELQQVLLVRTVDMKEPIGIDADDYGVMLEDIKQWLSCKVLSYTTDGTYSLVLVDEHTMY